MSALKTFVVSLVALGSVIAMAVLPSEAVAVPFKTIHAFCKLQSCKDGNGPGNLAADGAGNLFGITQGGGGSGGRGTIFELINGRQFKQLYRFCKDSVCSDGSAPAGPLVIDVNGNLYGVTSFGGSNNEGVVFKLTPNGDRTLWTLSVLYNFCSMGGSSCIDGANPVPNAGLTYAGAASGALYDGVSPLYGTTISGLPHGVVFELSLSVDHTTWTETVIYRFCAQTCADGSDPASALLFDRAGNLFGTTFAGGDSGQGTVFELSPSSGGTWSETVLHSFCSWKDCTDGAGPVGALIADSEGNLYGTASGGGSVCNFGENTFEVRCGTVFKLTPAGPSSAFKVLHAFCKKADCPDGFSPESALAIDATGNLFGMAQFGGVNDADPNHFGGGTVFELSGTHFRVLHAFCALDQCEDGDIGDNNLLINSSGALVGTTPAGGSNGEGGTVFTIKP